jgi:hypothetical protein
MSHTRGTSSTSKHQLNWTADKTITTQSTIKIATTPALAIDTANTWRSKMMIGIARARRTDSRLSIPYVSESIKECAQREREREEEERRKRESLLGTTSPRCVRCWLEFFPGRTSECISERAHTCSGHFWCGCELSRRARVCVLLTLALGTYAAVKPGRNHVI